MTQATNAVRQLQSEAQEQDVVVKTYPSRNGDAPFFIYEKDGGWALVGVACGVLTRLQPRLTASAAFDKFTELADYRE